MRSVFRSIFCTQECALQERAKGQLGQICKTRFKVHQAVVGLSNKLTLNLKKSNFVIFRPYQKRLPFIPKICIKDTVRNTSVYLECKEYVKYLGVLIDYMLSWKNHIGSVALKISKTIGLLSKLRHFVPTHTLINIYILLLPRICAMGLLRGDKQAKTN